jgi:hypothetical protein
MQQAIIILSLITLMAICKAIADTLYHHFFTSIFSKKDRRFWDPDQSWKYVGFIPLTSFHPDAWHFANFGFLFSGFLMMAIHKPILTHWYYDFGIGGVWFILIFNLFYNHILIRKT